MQKFTGIAFDSRLVKKGYLFIAVKGVGHDGHDFIKDALKKGAAAVIGERDPGQLGLPPGVKYTKVADSRVALGEYASEFYGNPSKKLKVIGVTGTKGKTTTTHLIHHILTSCGKKAGLVSSITSPGFHVTSPDVITLHKALGDMVKKGYEYAVLEVSSHGIDQARIAGVDFNIGVLTNIAPEHLDYHKTFEEYKRVKLSFINSAQEKVISPAKSSLNVLPGEFNNINAETAVNVAELLGIDRKRAISSLASFKLPAGRMEEIKNDLGVRIFVDFAHTPDSLEKALIYLKGITKGRLISVFGCAGERDPGKRSEMGKISSRIADLSVFTAEDPRTEDIFSIFRSMKKYAKNFVTIPERGEAIVHALSIARKGDTVAFFGKGHEKSLSYKGFEHPWSDQEMISSLINSSYKGISVIVLAAGRGTRMKSDKPKVLHEICGRPMLAYTLENLRFAGLMDVVVVVNFRKNWVMRAVGGAVKFAYQKTPKGGTADAANSGFPKVSKGADTIVVINGDDSAFYKPETIRRVIDIHKERQRILTFVSLMKEDPYGLGRVIRGRNGLITKIVEEKDATEAERRIKEVNDGLYVFEKKWFAKSIGKVKKGPQGEYYLVDLVKLAIDEGQRMATYTLPDDSEWQGINTPQQLEEANRKMLLKLKAYN